MKLCVVLAAVLLSPALLDAQTQPVDPGGILRQYTIARFAGSGTESIQAIASDADGNLFVAGTTSSLDLAVRNAAQPTMGDALIMRSTDRGQTWDRLPANPPAAPVAMAPDPSNPDTLFVCSNDALFKTDDGAHTWRRVYTFPPSSRCSSIAVDPTDTRRVYAAITTSDISYSLVFASADGGETWRGPGPRLAGFGGYPLWVDSSGSGIVGYGLWFSKDHGASWTPFPASPSSFPTFTVPDPRHPGTVYLATAAGTTGHLYVIRNLGDMWTPLPLPRFQDGSGEMGIGGLQFDPDFPNRLYATTLLGSFYISDDNGQTWRTTSRADGQLAILGRQCGGGALLSTRSYGPVGASLDFGVTWHYALSRVVNLSTAGCAAYVVRDISSDAFVAKLSPSGEVLWSTYFGGADQDSAAALAVDGQGNVYVAGNTGSPDFPSTVPRSGPVGLQNVFAAKFDAGGALMYSAVFGGEHQDGVTSIAVNTQGEAHVVGWTASSQFPTTAGAFQTQLGQFGNGFIIKLRPDGTAVYASYLAGMVAYSFDTNVINPPRALAIALEPGGSALVGGYSGMLARIDPTGSTLASLPQQRGQIFSMETDALGNVYIAGQSKSAPQSGPCFQGFRNSNPTLGPGDIFVTKLRAGDLQELVSAPLFGACQSWPGTLKVSSSGEITLGLWSLGAFPTRYPVLPFSNCGTAGSAVVARLSPDASTLLYSTFLDSCDETPPIALAPDGSIYAGVHAGPDFSTQHAGILKLSLPPPGGPSINGVFNAFTGNSGFLTPGMLLTITGSDMAASGIDLGLNDPDALPAALGGVQVLFNGAPAEMFQMDVDHAICVVPPLAPGATFATVQVVNGTQSSAPFVLPAANNMGFLTRSFPLLPAGMDANVRNDDGTLNDAQHPAAAGSVVTLFATGIKRPGPVDMLWNAPPVRRYEYLEPYVITGTARQMPGFVHAIWAVDVVIPPGSPSGRNVVGRVDSGLGVYVK